jgi:L,D-transpeptidase ErfK/SrfK
MKKWWYFLANSLLVVSANVFALHYKLPSDGSTIVGEIRSGQTIAGDSLTSIGRRYEMGIFELKEANPSLQIGKTYGPGLQFIVPSEFILPNAPHKGIVVNLAELRLYFYVPNTKEVMTFPVGIGRQGWDTPLGQTFVAYKMKDPTWVVPKTIKDARLADGIVLPDSVAPGPNNPLGGYELRLGLPAYLIHGSNDPSGIGRRSSSGCIRMQPEAIESFYDLVPVDLPVIIVDEPVKIGWLENDLYLEVHMPLQDDFDSNATALKQEMRSLVESTIAKRPATVNWDLAEQAVVAQQGIPIKIGEGLGPMPRIVVPLNPGVQKPKNQVHGRKTIEKKKLSGVKDLI